MFRLVVYVLLPLVVSVLSASVKRAVVAEGEFLIGFFPRLLRLWFPAIVSTMPMTLFDYSTRSNENL